MSQRRSKHRRATRPQAERRCYELHGCPVCKAWWVIDDGRRVRSVFVVGGADYCVTCDEWLAGQDRLAADNGWTQINWARAEQLEGFK